MVVDYLVFGTLVALLAGATVVGLRRQRQDALNSALSRGHYHDPGSAWLMHGGSSSGSGFDCSWGGGGGFHGGGFDGGGGGGGSGGHGGHGG